jgi:hypothetical protein
VVTPVTCVSAGLYQDVRVTGAQLGCHLLEALAPTSIVGAFHAGNCAIRARAPVTRTNIFKI